MEVVVSVARTLYGDTVAASVARRPGSPPVELVPQ